MKPRYRAYDTIRRCWIYWDDLAISPVTPAENYQDGCVWQSAAPHGDLVNCHGDDSHIIYQQSLYRNDANGREIFEGDVLRYKINPHLLQDEYETWVKNGKPQIIITCGAKHRFNKDAVVIGNIFDNPELADADKCFRRNLI